MAKLRVGVLFGSRSVEHDVSIVTARQVMLALDPAKYEVVPIYIAQDGQWLTGRALIDSALSTFKQTAPKLADVQNGVISPDPTMKGFVGKSQGGLFGFGKAKALDGIDIAFPCVHGTHGEDGTLQGLLELADLPYVGSGVVGSAVGMDKIMMKAAFAAADIPFVPYRWFTGDEWKQRGAAFLEDIAGQLSYPLFVKPANLGSSIGINRATNYDELEYAVEVAVKYDRRILVEQGMQDIVEINCSVLGNDDLSASACEQPARWQDLLTYEDKYLAGAKGSGMGGQQRQIPAPIGDEMTDRVKNLAKRSFRAIDAAGIARIDMMTRESDGSIWVNEVNTIPGSLSFYLWEPVGVPFSTLCDRLISLGMERHQSKRDRVTRYDNSLLSSMGGPKQSAARRSVVTG